MLHLRLSKGMSYSGVVTATKREPDVFVNDQKTANAALATGYFALVDDQGIQEPPKAPIGTITKIDTMNLNQLKKHAKDNDVDISGLTRLEDIRARIGSAEAAKANGAGDGDDDPTGQFAGGEDNGAADDDKDGDENNKTSE